MDQKIIDVVSKSYGRCCLKPVFWDMFYKNFLGGSPEAKEMFKNTNMEKQKNVLKESINFVIMYARNEESVIAKNRLNHVGHIHSKSQLNVKPTMYNIWIESLIKTLKEFEGENFNIELERAWRAILNPAINLLKSQYEQ